MTVKKIEKKKIRLIGLDLDGTTLTTDKRLTPHTKEVLEACINRYTYRLPATGRVWSGIPKELTDIEGVRYVISSNGAAVVELATGKAVYTNGIGWERALEIFDLLEEYDTFYDAYAMGNGWCEGRFYDDLDAFGIEHYLQPMVKKSRTRIDDLRGWVREHKFRWRRSTCFLRMRKTDRKRSGNSHSFRIWRSPVP